MTADADAAATPTSPDGPRAALDGGGGSRRAVLSWAMWDWGTQPFDTVVTTFVFTVYLTSASFGESASVSKSLAYATAAAGVLVALLAPVLGQSSDRSGRTVRNLRLQTWTLALICAALFFVRPEPGFLWLGLALFAAGSVVSEIASVNYNATIDQVATGRTVGRVSGFGWGMGYLGGILVLLLIYVAFIAPKKGLFGVSDTDGLDIRVSMVVCGLWILLFTIPTFLGLKERLRAQAPRVGIAQSYRLLFASLRSLWRTSRQTVYFLLASALFRDGLAGIFTFGAVLAAGTFGMSAGEVIIFGAAANIVAGLATMLFGLIDDRLGPRRVILLALVVLLLVGLAIFVLHDGGAAVFWPLGLLMSAFVGPAQAASRSFLARVIPEGRTGEIFGLYATTGRAVSFLSPLAFAAAISLGQALTHDEDVQYWGILGVALILAGGLAAMLCVRDDHGHAVVAERTHA